ncbi:MAG: AAA family ATPase [Chlorobi bacterium]|nr:AAA family ATPase [Chlorobiota bacterium]
MKDINHNPELKLAYDFVQYTDKNIFLTGKAGTGKTTFLQDLKEHSPKRMIVVAPTGVAAINAGGVTIHSFFQLAFGPNIPGYTDIEAQKSMRFSSQKRNIIKSLDLLVIDEISMVRADLLDGIDEVLRRFRRNNEPFGGVQMLMIGDMQQLPPVVRGQEWNLLRQHYDTAFFFSSLALKKTSFITITLKHVYRQKDEHFVEILNKIRDKQMDEKALGILNSRYIPDFDPGDENYIILTTHNAKAQSINNKKLAELKPKSFYYDAEVKGNFSEYNFPTDEKLELKLGSQVMFVKNDPEPDKKFFNGKIGVISSISKDEILVRCPDDTEEIEVRPLVWENIKYSIDQQSKEISESVEGTFTQIPLKLAWAITIHKSQGLTFDKAIIDSELAFAHGQVYVALSRCRSLEGMVLSTRFSTQSLKTDHLIDSFSNSAEKSQPDEKRLKQSKAEYIEKTLVDLFNFELLRSNLQWLRRLSYSNKRHVLETNIDMLDKVQDDFNKNIFEVGKKFSPQLHNLLLNNHDAGNNDELQERIKKAVEYFLGKLRGIVSEKISSYSIESDNKEITKKLQKAEKFVLEELAFKTQCLEYCTNGFALNDYLQFRAKASMEPPTKAESKSRGKQAVSVEVHNPDLYKTIKAWRDTLAVESDVSHFMIMPLKTMRALSNQAPSNMEELKMVHGMGRKKIEAFGEEILEIIKHFRKNNEVKILDAELPKKKKKSPKTDTRLVSLELWEKHRDVEKVAKERSLAVSTILGHLITFVGSAKLSVNEFISEDKLNKIIPYFEKDLEIPLSEIIEQTGSEFSYNDLRFVREHLRWLKTNE